MRAIVIERYGEPEVLMVGDFPVPEPGAGEVRVRTVAAAVNPTDTGLRAGSYAGRIPGLALPHIPGMDLSGVVDKVGGSAPGASRLRRGDRVAAFVNPYRPAGGAQAEYVVIPEDQAMVIPDGWNLAAAASLPMNGLSADLALRLLGLGPGQTLIVTGAAGALGGYAVQLAVRQGIRVFADAFAKDHGLVSSLGASVIVPRGPDLVEAYRKALPEGADAIIDAAVIGQEAVRLVRDGGQVVKCRPYELRLERGIADHRLLVVEHPDIPKAIAYLTELVSQGALTLRIDGYFSPEDAPLAHRRLQAGGLRGRQLIIF